MPPHIAKVGVASSSLVSRSKINNLRNGGENMGDIFFSPFPHMIHCSFPSKSSVDTDPKIDGDRLSALDKPGESDEASIRNRLTNPESERDGCFTRCHRSV